MTAVICTILITLLIALGSVAVCWLPAETPFSLILGICLLTTLAVLCVPLVAGLVVIKGTEPRPVCECRCPSAKHVPPLVKERVPEIGARYL